MEVVNIILGREVPATNGIPVNPSENNADLSTSQMETGKKILLNVDNLSEKEQKRRNTIEQIQALHKDGVSVQEISQITGKDRRTVKKYLEGDPQKLCHSNAHGSLEKYTDFIIKNIKSGLTYGRTKKGLQKQINVYLKKLKALGWEVPVVVV